MVVAVPPASSMPAVMLPTATAPLTSVPIKFPAIKVPVVAAPVTMTPSAFPEMKLRAAADGPADRVGRGTGVDQHAGPAVAQGDRARLVQADQVSLDEVGTGVAQISTPWCWPR